MNRPHLDKPRQLPSNGKNADRHLLVIIHLIDDLPGSNPVDDAAVAIDVTRDGNLVATGVGVTGATGTITFTIKNV